MYHKIEELAYNGDVQAIWSMLKDIVNNTWDIQRKTVHMTDPDTGENMVGSSFEAQRTSPRDLSEEELSIVKKLSDILLSRIDSLSDEELFHIAREVRETTPAHRAPSGREDFDIMGKRHIREKQRAIQAIESTRIKRKFLQF